MLQADALAGEKKVMTVFCEKFIQPRLGRLGDFPFDRSAPHSTVRTDSAVSRSSATSNRRRFRSDKPGRSDRGRQRCPDGATTVQDPVDLGDNDLQNGGAGRPSISPNRRLCAILPDDSCSLVAGAWRLETVWHRRNRLGP